MGLSPREIQGESGVKPYVQKFCAVDIFWNKTKDHRLRSSSRVRAWLHDSAGDVDFYQKVSQPIRINYFT